MVSWKISKSKNKVTIDNGKNEVEIYCSPKSNPDIGWLLGRMKTASVPISFTFGLRQIRFTKLRGVHGDYFNGVLRLSTDKRSWEIADVVFIHEIAHHIDEIFKVTVSKDLIKEKLLRSRYMPDGYAEKNTSEYFACGFEIYYFGKKEHKLNMRKKNPILFKTIRSLHKKFSKFC